MSEQGAQPLVGSSQPAEPIPDNSLPPPPPTIRVTRVLDRIFVLMRNRFWLIYGITLVVYVPFFFYNLLMRQFNVSMMEGGSPLFMRGEILAGLLVGFIVFMLAWIFIWPLGTMAATSALARGYLGKTATVWSSYREVLRLLFPALGMMMIYGLLVGIGSMLCLVPGIYFMLRLFVIYPVLAVERRRVFDCIGRSSELMRGNYWPVMLVMLSIFFVKAGLTYAISFTGAAAFGGTSVVEVVLYSVSQFVGQLFIAPIDFIAAVVVYFELREVKEGLDLELMAGELAESFKPSLGDPPASEK